MPPAPVPTPAQIQSLYTATKTAASRFSSYNYLNYFVRRTDQVFRPALAEKLDSSEMAKFYEDRTNELEVLKRAAEVNSLFKGPQLVVEHPRVITSGGGAGMEASAGGGGQPE